MADLHVCAPAFYPSKHEIRFLCRSADKYGIKINCFGVGEVWENHFEAEVIEFRKHLESVDAEHVLCVDSFDSIFVAGEDKIMEAYEVARKGKDLLIQTIDICWPHPLMKEFYDARAASENAPEYRYPISGALIGKTDVMIKALDSMIKARATTQHWFPARNDDQGWWYIGIKSGFFDAQLDYECMVSLCTFRKKLVWFEMDNGYGIKGNPTCIVHTGKAKRGGFGKLIELEDLGV